MGLFERASRESKVAHQFEASPPMATLPSRHFNGRAGEAKLETIPKIGPQITRTFALANFINNLARPSLPASRRQLSPMD